MNKKDKTVETVKKIAKITAKPKQVIETKKIAFEKPKSKQ